MATQGIPTHFIKSNSKTSIVVQKLDVIPLHVLVRNYAAGNMVKGKYQEREKLPEVFIEYYRESDKQHDNPLQTTDIVKETFVTPDELDRINGLALSVNKILKSLLDKVKIRLIDFRLEFGRKEGRIILRDVITPENLRLWDVYSDIMLDKKEWMIGKNPELFERVYVEACGKIIAEAERQVNKWTKEQIVDIPFGPYRDYLITDKSDIKPALGVDLIAKEVANLLLNMKNEKGMMVGIFANWGRGKTFLMERIWKNLAERTNNPFHDVIFHAWKYQDTPASWAYLYELLAEKYYQKPRKLFSLSWLSYSKKLVSLNFMRKGWVPIINICLGIIASVITAYLFSHFADLERIDQLAANLGISLTFMATAVGILNYLKKEYSSKAVRLLRDYSSRRSFKDFLGIQAEIQKELKVLLKNWISSSEVENESKRILLFVDDIDRCNEERIIQIIDSLRVMLEEEGIFERIIVMAAVDVEVLKRAINVKYAFILNGENTGDNIDKIDSLVKEYLDKLFLISIQLPQLSAVENKEILDVFTIDRGKVAPIEQNESDHMGTETEEDQSQKQRLTQNFSEPDDVSSNKKEAQNLGRNKNLGNESKEENNYELSHGEYELLTQYIELLKDATPRKIRIFYYRYLLARNLLDIILRGTKLRKTWDQETDKSVLPELILNPTLTMISKSIRSFCRRLKRLHISLWRIRLELGIRLAV